MFDELYRVVGDISWPLALVFAWAAGEAGRRWMGLPRISSYAIAGFILAPSQSGFLPEMANGSMGLLANMAMALILFELGYRINLKWLKSNPWLGVTSLVESSGTFIATYFIAIAFGLGQVPALLLAALTVPTSPAAVLRVVNELRGSGQVTERTLHLSAFNCILAVLVFKGVLGYGMLNEEGGIAGALWNSLVVVLVSSGVGILFGVAVPALLRVLGRTVQSSTVGIALAVLLLTALTHALKFSPLLAALAFGLVVRHRRVQLTSAQRNFGAIGDLLTVLLFVFVAATLDWRQVMAGFELALVVTLARLLVKVGSTTLFARLSGISWRKGMLSGVALMPLSVFAILLLEQTRHLGVGLVDQLAGVAAIALMLEVLGPIATQWALLRAAESNPEREH